MSPSAWHRKALRSTGTSLLVRMLLSELGFGPPRSQREEKSQPDSAPALSSASRVSRFPVGTRQRQTGGQGLTHGPGPCSAPSLPAAHLPARWRPALRLCCKTPAW